MATIPGPIRTVARVAVATFPAVPVPVGRQTVSLPVVMTAIAIAQSHGDATIGGDRLGTCEYCTRPACGVYTSWGLWQIHLGAHIAYLEQVTHSTDPCTWAQWLQNPAHNAQAAWAILAPDGQIPASAVLIARLNGAWGGQAGNWQDYVSTSQLTLAAAAVAAVRSATTAAFPSAAWIGVGVGLVALGAAAAVIDIRDRQR
jgi:hypothetical protein